MMMIMKILLMNNLLLKLWILRKKQNFEKNRKAKLLSKAYVFTLKVND